MKRLLSLFLTLALCAGMFALPNALAYSGTDDPSHVHHWVVDEEIPASCTTPGVRFRHCTECGKWEEVTIPALGHWYSDEWYRTKEPTCTTAGREYTYCVRVYQGRMCGHEKIRDIPPLGHDWGPWQVIKVPTAEEDGYEERVCQRCGITEQRPLKLEDYELPEYELTLTADLKDAQSYYMVDDTVYYTATVTNTGKNTLYFEWFYYYDPYYNNGAFANQGDKLLKLEPGESYTSTEHSKKITQEIMDDFAPVYKQRMQALAFKTSEIDYDNAVTSNEEIVSAILGEYDGAYLYVSKEEISTPENGAYPLDSLVTYLITVSNMTDQTWYDVDIFDMPYNSEGALEHIANFPVLEPHKAVSAYYQHQIDELDIENGEYVNGARASATYTPNPEEEEGDRGFIDAEPVTVYTGEGDIGDMELWIEKTEISEPANGVSYAENEVITYEVQVWNLQSWPYYQVKVYDAPDKDDPEKLELLGETEELEPHGTRKYTYTHTVTAEDCANGYVYNDSAVEWLEEKDDEEFQFMNGVPVVSPCGEPKVWLRKHITSSPANGYYYAEGEEICYKIEWGANIELADAELNDSMQGNGFAVYDSSEGSLKGLHELEYTYTVQPEDKYLEWVVNYVELCAIDTEGNEWYKDASAGARVAMPGEGGLVLEKTEISVPANGVYYVEGEQIVYQIRVYNPGDVTVTDAEIRDPLLGDCDDGIVAKIPELKPQEELFFLYSYYVTEADVANALVDNQASATYKDGNGNTGYTSSNVVIVPTSGTPAETPLTLVTLIKTVKNTPANGMFFVENEEVVYEIFFVNDSDFDVTELRIYDEDQLIGSFDVVPACSSTPIIEFTHTVTAKEAEDGWAENAACGFYLAGDSDEPAELWSDVVYVPTGKEPDSEEKPLLTVTKTVINPPANGSFYVPGEQIHYLIVATNQTDKTIEGDLYDKVNFASNAITDSMTLAPHKSYPAVFSYTVKDTDPDWTSIIMNQADSYYRFVGSGNKLEYAASDMVVSWIGQGVPIPPNINVFMTKIISDLPENGSYYVEGEEVEFDLIITNFTGFKIGKLEVYDILLDTPGCLLTTVTDVSENPLVLHLTYKISASDAAMPFITNIGWANVYFEGVGGYGITSNEVEVPTGSKPQPPVRHFGRSCEITLLSESDEGASYGCKYCTEHAAVQDRVASLIAEAETEEQKLEALRAGVQIWKDNLASVYERLINASDDAVAEALQNDRTMTEADFNAYTNALSALTHDEAVILEKQMELLRGRTCELCYTAGTAPEARKDSMLADVNEYKSAAGAQCAVYYDEAADHFVRYETVCAAHMPISRMAGKLVAVSDADNRLTALDKARAYWLKGIAGVYDTLENEAEGLTERYALQLGYRMFDTLLDCRRALYDAYYPDAPELGAELVCSLARGRLADLCETGE